MALVGLHLLILVVLEILHSGVGRQKACSCYTFEDGSETYLSWPQAKASCEYYNKSLIAMERLQEWEFINRTIKGLTSGHYDEWHIGLFKNLTNGNWTWINGRPLTIEKWQKGNPRKGDLYALIAREFPSGSYGLFDGIKGNTERGWICEEETDNCDGSCMFQYPPPTTASPTRSTITEIKESTRPPSTATPDDRTYLSDSTTLPTVPSKHILKEDKNFFTAFIAAASLAAMLFIALIAVVVVSLLWRKNQRGKGVERTHTTASSNQLEEPCENASLLNPGNAARQLGLSVEARDSGNVATRQLTAQPCIPEGGYAVLNPRTITSEGSCYEPLVPSKQEKRTSADCSETPIYVNQKAMPEYMNVSA